MPVNYLNEREGIDWSKSVDKIFIKHEPRTEPNDLKVGDIVKIKRVPPWIAEIKVGDKAKIIRIDNSNNYIISFYQKETIERMRAEGWSYNNFTLHEKYFKKVIFWKMDGDVMVKVDKI